MSLLPRQSSTVEKRDGGLAEAMFDVLNGHNREREAAEVARAEAEQARSRENALMHRMLDIWQSNHVSSSALPSLEDNKPGANHF